MEIVLKHRDGFRGALARAIRCEEPTHDEYNDEHGTTITTATTTTATRFVDWSSHTVDYPRFKKRLQFFARRRSQIRAMIRNSTDQRLSEQVLVDLLGPKTAFPVRQKGWEKNQHPQQAQEQQQQTANNNNNINSNEYDNAIQNQHQHSHNNYTNHMYASMPDDDDDHPNNVPLSCNLSMDPHSHIGMGGDTSAERSVVVREGGPPSSVTFPSSNTTTDNTKTAIGNRNNPRRFQNHNYNNSTNNNNAPTNYAAAATAPHHYVAMPGGGAASSHNTLAFGGGPPAMMIGDSGSTVEEGSQSSSASNATSSKNNTNHNSKNVPRHGVDDQFPPPKRRTQRSIMRRLSVSERNEIILFLEWEMDKALMFYLSQWQKLSHRLERLQRLRHEQQQHKRQQHQSYRPPTTTPATRPEDDHWAPVSLLPTSLDESPLTPDPTIEEDDDNENGDPNNDDECGFVHDAALEDEILELFCFCVTNIITVQQILVRYDAFARAFEGTPMLNFFMKKVTKYPTSFRKILYHEELHAIANFYQDHHSTTTTTTTGTSSSHNNNNAIAASVASSGAATASETTTSATSLLNRQQMEFAAQRQYLAEILDSIQSAWSMNGATNSAAAQNISHTDACLYAMRKLFLVGLFEDRLGLEPAYLTSRGQSLTNEMEHIALWRKNKRTRRNNNNNNLLNMNDMKHSKRKEKKLSSMQQFHLALNLVAAFLYCMNYYIVEPSSTLYVNRLGAYDAMSGTLIGMMPLAAFVSSIPYSMWTNHSFRHPFIMSCCMLILGNLLYSMADLLGSVWVALLGRFVSGLGAPKCIIRRYMADTTPVSLRTGVNAGFGMVVAAGSAMGPAMAIVLNKFNYTSSHIQGLGYVTLNGLTLPGYFMACMWTIFGMVVVLTFREPDREGLKEQKEMEAQSALKCASSTGAGTAVDSSSVHANDDHSSVISTDSSGVTQQQIDRAWEDSNLPAWMIRIGQFFDLVTLPVRICLGLLFCKVFTIESLVSATSALTKNRYKWHVQEVGMLGLTNGLLVIPFSILVGRLSMTNPDHVLMKWLVSMGCFGMFLLVDLSDIVASNTRRYNEGHILAVSPKRYILGYFLSYISIQAFEGVIGSTLSKVIPTALASGTFNSGLLATLVDTFGRACGDLYISAAGFISLRQLMNLLFIPGFLIMLGCLVVIERCRDLLSV